MTRVGVVLSGCGVKDGSEIHESVITLLALDRLGAEAVCIAPNVPQMDVVDHLKGEPARELRNVLVESARIARGKIVDVKDVRAGDLDALIFPGGFGAAKNICDFAVKGAECTVNPDVKRLAREMHEAKKPIGAICIAPTIVAKIFEGTSAKPKLTIGNDKGTADALVKMGAEHVDRDVRDTLVDEENRIVTTPAYMCATRISEAADGIEKLVGQVLAMARAEQAAVAR